MKNRENKNIDIINLLDNNQILIQTVYKIADHYEQLNNLSYAHDLRNYARDINDDVEAEHSRTFFKNFYFEQENSYKNNENGHKLESFVIKSISSDENPILFINITERSITNSDLSEPTLSSREEIKINHNDSEVVHLHFFNNSDDAYNNFIQQRDFLTSIEHNKILSTAWENSPDHAHLKNKENNISEIIKDFKNRNPQSLFEIDEKEPFLAYDKNKVLIDVMSNLKPDVLAESYDDLSPSKAAYSFLWNDCVHLNDEQTLDLSVRDLWTYIPNHIQKEIIEAVFSEKTLKNNNGIILKEYAEKSIWGEEENSSYLPKVYQVSDSKTKETLSIGLDLAEANESFKKLSSSNKSRPKFG